MKNKKLFAIIALGAAALIYIRYLQIDIEIARFDYMMKVMKEEQKET